MAPKTRAVKSEWVRCHICHNYFSSRDSVCHADMCQLETPTKLEVNASDNTVLEDSELSNISPSTLGYFNGDFLIAIPKLKTECQDDIPVIYKDSIIYLNPKTLKLLKLSIGHIAVIEHTYAVRVWLDHSMPLTYVAFSEILWKELHLEKCEVVTVHALLENSVNAESVHLYQEPNSNEVLKQRSFHAYLKRFLEGKLITGGNQINTTFYGHPVKLTVAKIIGENLEESSLKENSHLLPDYCNIASDISSDINVDKLIQILDKTNLSDNSSILSSSPVKKIKEEAQKQGNFSKSYQNVKFFLITSGTDIKFLLDTSKELFDEPPAQTIHKIGGYECQINVIDSMLNRVFVYNNVDKIEQFSISKGVLIYGPSGCGKTKLARSLINTYHLHHVSICGSDIWSKYYGESETRLRSLFKEAKDRAPSVILLDEIDILCPKRDSSQADIEKRILTCLLTLIDDIVASGTKIFLIATTNKRDNIDPSLRRPGRLDREIEISVPSAADRFKILEALLKDLKCNIVNEDIQKVANSAHGFVGADVEALVKEASLHSVKRSSSTSDVLLCVEDLMFGLSIVQPSAMREVAIEVPNVKWSDIGGQLDLKHKLKQAIEWPLKHPEAFLRLGIRPPKGLLMYGPPGCSKTMIAKALANESGINFIAIKGPELFSKWVGESEKAVREVFRKARSAAPAIVFFDEIDALAGERGSSGGGGDVSDRVLAQLLTEIDGVEALQDVTVVAATNRPDRIDKALLRPGRLDRIIYVALPDAETRKEIFHIQFRNMPISEDITIDELVSKTHKYSGAEVTAVCHEAALNAMEEDVNISRICTRHFQAALKLVTPRTKDSLLQFYDSYAGISGLHSV